MTTLKPREPYTPRELEQLYPSNLQLQLVQVVSRYSGMAKEAPFPLVFRIQPGELTDKGRETTLALGERLRHLYINQLHFMPHLLSSPDSIYLRATPMPRALESVQQTFWGFYPPSSRAATFPPPTILTRSPSDETLYPNDSNCRRLAQLSLAFAQRCAERWNESSEMEYLNRKLGKWMPESSPRVKVDSHPRLSGIMDTVNATLAHGPETKLPSEFYDEKVRAIIDRIAVEEWFAGYVESREYRALGIGALVGDLVSRMVGSVEEDGRDGIREVGDGLGEGRGGEKRLRMGLMGCHDTTLAGMLAALGAYEGEPWPPYTSHIAVELFKQKGVVANRASGPVQNMVPRKGWWESLFGMKEQVSSPGGIGRRSIGELSEAERSKLDDYFVRIRYNDKPVTVPGCKLPGKHLEGDESFCTLEAFKAIADKFTPRHWKQECLSNLDQPEFPTSPEPAGYER
ncbi:MAG: hypothetical protein M1820_002170 [Bogoriella megaspora]|nr:MAG: hypothetical protein M1820_002170 [Bogoriella megaspora]